MKLNRNNKYQRYVATGLICTSLMTFNYFSSKDYKENQAPDSVETTEMLHEETVKNDFVPFTEEQVIEGISSLNVEEREMPYNAYKVVTFRDTNDYYRIMIVNTKIFFDTDDNGNIKKEVYLVYDAFSNELLFKTDSFDNEYVDAYNEIFSGSKIISFDSVERLYNLSYWNGVPGEYISSLIPNCEQYDCVSNMNIARLYVSLTPERYRVNYSDLINLEVNIK